ncbi:hypothetical protein [Virgisporangium aurantiacum]|uniref:CARDB domain-containing protein n=1 Tax=Virgisporangium aurantiacum TaxID=175570 RepID=A0A8J4DW84_9ACTN|nr:hypothetical protein [Virgisporangium aurantiacum]GIJ52599.1 hypothetical protein Vau01_001150 [Virgisporangium aurantiacum]
MADPGDVEVQEMFARFRAESIADHPAPDLARVRGMARRRQVTRRTMLSVAALALVAVPAVGLRLAAQDVHSPSTGGPPQQQVSGAPTERPPDSPSTAASVSSATLQKPVTKADIMVATITIPNWPKQRDVCPSGEVNIGKLGAVTMDQQFSVGKVITFDVDRDGDEEAVGIFSCGYESAVDQVLAVGRNDQGGLRTLGRVVASSDADPLMDVLDVRTGTDGAVDVNVGERIDQAEPEFVEKQWRSYRWNGQKFPQVGGERQFTPMAPATDVGLSVTTGPFGAPAAGVWTGTVTVTVTNAGPNRAPGIYLDLYVSSGDGAALSKPLKVTPECTTEDVRVDGRLTGVHVICHQPALASGANRTTAFQVRLPTANGARDLNVSVFGYAEQPGVRALRDVGPQANSAILTLAAPAR